MKSREIKIPIQTKHDSPLGRILVLTGARQTGKTTLARNGRAFETAVDCGLSTVDYLCS